MPACRNWLIPNHRSVLEENITNTYFTALVARQSSEILDSTLTAIRQHIVSKPADV